MLASQTKAMATYRIFPGQLNGHETLFGGQILLWLDDITSVSAQRFTRREVVTGSFDQMRFIAPVRVGDALEITTYVSGVGHRSLEVFAKLVGEHLGTGERYLAGTAFATYVVMDNAKLPDYQADFEEAAAVNAGYAKRRSQPQIDQDLLSL
ncbi:acyl-CoA thioesterase [Lacticaseibacillus saniviri]